MRIELSLWHITGLIAYCVIGFFVFGFVMRDTFSKGKYIILRFFGSIIFSAVFGAAWIVSVPITLGFILAVRYSDPIRPPRLVE